MNETTTMIACATGVFLAVSALVLYTGRRNYNHIREVGDQIDTVGSMIQPPPKPRTFPRLRAVTPTLDDPGTPAPATKRRRLVVAQLSALAMLIALVAVAPFLETNLPSTPQTNPQQPDAGAASTTESTIVAAPHQAAVSHPTAHRRPTTRTVPAAPQAAPAAHTTDAAPTSQPAQPQPAHATHDAARPTQTAAAPHTTVDAPAPQQQTPVQAPPPVEGRLPHSDHSSHRADGEQSQHDRVGHAEHHVLQPQASPHQHHGLLHALLSPLHLL